MSNRGRRYDNEPKLNMKKVLGVVIAFAVIIMIIISTYFIENEQKGKR